MSTGHVLWALAASNGLQVKKEKAEQKQTNKQQQKTKQNQKTPDKAKLLKLDYFEKPTPELGFTDDEKFSTKKSNISHRLLGHIGA